jgi:hypothetical protein
VRWCASRVVLPACLCVEPYHSRVLDESVVIWKKERERGSICESQTDTYVLNENSNTISSLSYQPEPWAYDLKSISVITALRFTI